VHGTENVVTHWQCSKWVRSALLLHHRLAFLPRRVFYFATF